MTKTTCKYHGTIISDDCKNCPFPRSMVWKNGHMDGATHLLWGISPTSDPFVIRLAFYNNEEDAKRDILPAMNAGYRKLKVVKHY